MYGKKWNCILNNLILHRSMSYMRRADLYKRCYEVLKVSENADQNTVRRSYIELVKKYHPDSGNQDASIEKFQELDECFKFLMQKYAKARRNIEMDPEEEVKVFDIKHTAPQHRVFLSNEGYGAGTIFQREKQYQQIRAMRAQQNVLEHRMQKAVASDNALIKKGDHFKKHAIKTKYGFDRVVEDLIMESMHKGDFNNLSGQGKPLDHAQSQNPYVDFVTHKLNKILLDNGFQPEFITLSKEIRESIQEVKDKLKFERSKLKFPADDDDKIKWTKVLKEYENDVKNINKQIDKFNLICPILNKQMVQIRLQVIADKILDQEPEKYYTETPKQSTSPSDYNHNFLSVLSSIWK
ncbi:dnaJ homolog subfamily C member 28 [Chironomus tepperi]|uniref:dnaJ homolog subfamily C member 28 n=1 Tax=Chironomus tepperi TaxID=113505 RepID=UPI00391EF2CB